MTLALIGALIVAAISLTGVCLILYGIYSFVQEVFRNIR